MAGEDFFKFNKGNEFRFSNFREIKEEDLKGADEKTKKLFNIFAGEDKILQEVEAKSLFNVLKTAAGDNQVLEDNEIKAFAKEHIGEEVDTNALMTFVNNIFGTKEKPQTQAVQVAKGYTAQKQQTFLEEAACKEIVIDIIDENLSEAYEILNSQYLGSISGWHDEKKDKNDILKTSNVSKVLDYQNAGIEWMNKAKIAPPNGLTKKEYYEGNKQRIKDMILTRVLVLDTNTKFKELKNKYSEEKLAQIIGDYVEQLCSNASMEDLKDIQKQFVSYSGVEEIQALENVVDNAIKFNADKNKPMPYSEVPLPKFDNSKGIVPEYWNSDEPISFEEVYKIERGTEYSQYKIEQYALAKKEMEVVANAYNKKQQFVEFAEGLRKDETLNIDEKTQKVLEGFATFYALAEDGGLSQLQELIAESKLPISIDENGFNFGTLDDNAKNRALNLLLKLAQQSKEKEFEEFLNGKTIEDYQIALVQAHDEAIGDENGKMMAEAMKNDNLTCIQRWTGNTSMAGMGMTIVGGILCFTPLAPLGAGMITVGNTLAIGGMVAKTGLGVTDYATKDVQTAEEAEQLTKDFIMDAGGFIIGMGAGKAGLKAFSKLIDKKLVAVFGQQIASGNKMQALKTVFTNPEYLKNFMTAAGAKLSADFVISYAGDLAMMGILDTQDDWQSLLKANLTGILVGMSGDIKDVSGVGRPRNFGVSDGVKPMTEMDYGQRLLGNDVTVADPKTGATVEGTVTGLHNTNGQVEIEVNGQRYSTNDVAEVKGEAVVETSLSQKISNDNQRITESKFESSLKGRFSDEFVENYLKEITNYVNLEQGDKNFYKIVGELGTPEIIENWLKNSLEGKTLTQKINFFNEIMAFPELFKLQKMIKENSIDAKFDRVTGESIPAIPQFVRKIIIDSGFLASDVNTNFSKDKTNIRALISDCLEHPNEYKLYQMILDNPINAKSDRITGEPIPDMPVQVREAIKNGEVAPTDTSLGMIDVREFITDYLNNENLYKIRALILDNKIDAIDPNTGKPIYPISDEVRNIVQSQGIGTRFANPKKEWYGIDVNNLIKNCLKNPEKYELYELIKNNDINSTHDKATGVELPDIPEYLRLQIKSSNVLDLYNNKLDLDYYVKPFKESKNHFYGMKKIELQKYLENITDEAGNKITDLSRLKPDEIVNQLESLIGHENRNLILDVIQKNILTDKTNLDYNKTISEFINETINAKPEEIKLLARLVRSDKWEIRDTILRVLNEQKTSKDDLITSEVINKIDFVNKENKIYINQLLDLKENCDSPLLSIDNILYLAEMISKEQDKDNQTIMLNEIRHLLQQKNTIGRYILNKNNIKLLLNSEDLNLLHNNPDIDVQSYLKTLNTFHNETMDVAYSRIEIIKLVRKIYENNPKISSTEIEPALKIELQTQILGEFKDNPDIQNAIVSFFEKADYDLIKTTIESYNNKIEYLTEIKLEEILSTDSPKIQEEKTNRNMKTIQEAQNKWFTELLNSKNSTLLISDIESGLSDITDLSYKKIIQDDFNKIKNIKSFNESQIQQLQQIRSAINAYKVANNMSIDVIEKSYSKDFIEFITAKYPNISKLIINKPKTQIFDLFKNIRADIEADMKYFMTIDYCKNNNNKYADYLYESVYLKNESFPKELKNKCLQLKEKYGVKIFISNNLDSVGKAIGYIDEELNEWKTASGGKAFMPPVLDLLRAKRGYVDLFSAYGKGPSAAFSELANGAISIDGNQLSVMNYITSFSNLKKLLRHEMTHSNDTKNVFDFPDGYVVYKDNSRTLDITKCKFYDEFVAIGIPKNHIAYAYNNPMEFIAVASEGDLSKCSPEFKQALIDFGMPEWEFDLK